MKLARAQVLYAKKNRDSSSEVEALKSEPGALKSVVLRSAPPFVLRNDLARGALHALQSTLSFTFMLAAMWVFSLRRVGAFSDSEFLGHSRWDSFSLSSSVWGWVRLCLGGLVPTGWEALTDAVLIRFAFVNPLYELSTLCGETD